MAQSVNLSKDRSDSGRHTDSSDIRCVTSVSIISLSRAVLLHIGKRGIFSGVEFQRNYYRGAEEQSHYEGRVKTTFYGKHDCSGAPESGVGTKECQLFNVLLSRPPMRFLHLKEKVLIDVTL